MKTFAEFINEKFSYAPRGKFARIIASRIRQTCTGHNNAIVVDCSGSMFEYLEDVKEGLHAARLNDDNTTYSYFELSGELTQVKEIGELEILGQSSSFDGTLSKIESTLGGNDDIDQICVIGDFDKEEIRKTDLLKQTIEKIGKPIVIYDVANKNWQRM